tara:strand:- start:597 stop:1004 length:408 start_codon:yes stop_codon:yes gene_type:complete
MRKYLKIAFFQKSRKLIKITFSILILSYSSITISALQLDEESLYNSLIKEVRCMVCQNQNIAESEAPLAVDLRNKIREMIKNGKSENEIKQFMTDRYSSFILYDPPVNKQNIVLWFGPLLFMIIITFILFKKGVR